MQFWDTSALVKLYISEPDSAIFISHTTSGGPLICAELTRWEFYRVLVRKEAEGVITNGAAQIVFAKFLRDVNDGKVRLTPMDQILESAFRKLVTRLYLARPPLVLRTLDGIHIANAELHGAAEFVATDVSMRKCAAAIGLKLFP
jgi:predicted nucleic acid-binding protein